jgi:hypothetical protein
VIGDELEAPKANGFTEGENNPRHTFTVRSVDEGTIGTSRGKARCKSPFLARQLSVFFAPLRYMVVKIVCFCSEVVLRTTKHTMVYHGLGPSLEVIALRPRSLILKMNSGYNGVSRELENFVK